MTNNNLMVNSETAGLEPGTVVYVGEKNKRKLKIEALNFDNSSFEKREYNNIKDLAEHQRTQKYSWISVNGLNHTNVIEHIGKDFNLHPLVLEDIANTHQRPKLDEFGDYMFVVIKMLSFDDDENLCFEHIAFVLTKDHLITFQEADTDVFDQVRLRLKSNKARIREAGTDYLLYLLMDAVVDNYFHVTESLGKMIEEIEDSIFGKKSEADKAQEINDLKREILKMRRAVFPVRELIKRIEKTESKLLTDKTQFYLRDLLDHTIQVSEHVDIYRDWFLVLWICICLLLAIK